MRLVLVLALMGCGSKEATKPAPGSSSGANPATAAGSDLGSAASPTAGFELPALYKDLFVSDKVWPFTSIDETLENGKPVAGGEYGLTCSVDEVKRTPTVVATSVHCVDSNGDTSAPRHPRGVFVATRDGLWQTCLGHCREGIGDLATIVLDPKRKLLGPTPVATEVEWKQTEDGQEALIFQRVAAYKTGWCITTTEGKRDGNGWILCLAPGAGIIGGRGFDHPKPTRHSVFGDAPLI